MSERIALAGLYVMSLSALLVPAPANLALLAMAIAAGLRHRAFLSWLRRTPPAWLAFAFTGYVLLRGAAEIGMGDLAPAAARKPITGWALLGMTPVVAFWVAGREDRCRRMLLLCLAGLLLEAARHMDAHALGNIMALRREDFGLRLLGAPLYAAIAMLGLLVFRHDIQAWLRGHLRRPWRRFAYAGLTAAFAALLMMFLFAQSRSSWLAALLAFPLTGLGLLLSGSWRSPKRLLRRIGVALGAVALLALVLAPSVGGMLAKRVASESQTWSAMVAGRWDEVPYTSIGRRFHMTMHGLRWFAEAPLTGIGPGGVAPRLQATEQLNIHEDLHNSYLDLAVETGLIGALLLFGGLVWSYVGLVQAYREGVVGREMFWFLTGTLLIYLLVAALNTRLVNFDGQFSWLLLTGMVLGLAYRAGTDPQERDDFPAAA